MKKSTTLIAVAVIIVIIAVGYFVYQKGSVTKAPVACTMEAKICPDGSSVGRTPPNCEFAECPSEIVYKNEKFGFQITLPSSWKNYSTAEQNWQGRVIDTGEQKYSGAEVVIKNPQATPQQAYQDIPVMVFTKDVWNLVAQEKVAVSAAPIGPAKIGENTKYIFATPPRWYGFTDAIGIDEALNIVKTFKTF